MKEQYYRIWIDDFHYTIYEKTIEFDTLETTVEHLIGLYNNDVSFHR